MGAKPGQRAQGWLSRYGYLQSVPAQALDSIALRREAHRGQPLMRVCHLPRFTTAAMPNSTVAMRAMAGPEGRSA